VSLLKNSISNQKESLLSFLTAAGAYIFLFLFLYSTLFFLGFITSIPDDKNIIRWDANWYESIKNTGYYHFWFQSSNSAFFPFFPYAWRLFHVGPIGISLINLFVFFTGAYILFRQFSFSRLQLLICISIPSSIFFLLPYTESFFFLFSALLLSGLHRNNTRLILLSLFLCSVTRATTLFFVPAIIVMELFAEKKLITAQKLKNIFYYCLAALAGLFTVVLIQFAQTGVWFAFAKMQVKFWRHRFSWPRIPFCSFGDDKIIWLDGLALFFGLLASACLLIFFIRYLRKSSHPLLQNKAFWFSATYLFMTTVYSLFFNEHNPSGATSIMSINRYLFSTAFFFVFLHSLFLTFSLNIKTTGVFILTLLLTCLLLGLGMPLAFLKEYQSYHRTTFFFLAFSFYLALYLLVLRKECSAYAGTVLFTVNVLLSVYLLFLFITEKWVA
jgi:hypothetical protein